MPVYCAATTCAIAVLRNHQKAWPGSHKARSPYWHQRRSGNTARPGANRLGGPALLNLCPANLAALRKDGERVHWDFNSFLSARLAHTLAGERVTGCRGGFETLFRRVCAADPDVLS